MATDKAKHLSTREKVSIKILMLIIKILQPTGYSHELKEEFKSILDDIKED